MKQSIFPSIPAIGIFIRKVLASIQLDDKACFLAKKVDFHMSLVAERDREPGIQTKFAPCGREGLKSPE
ncbi:MAG: hypothetical protein Fur0032_14200 [Terrimicrobiaceae bacterium]